MRNWIAGAMTILGTLLVLGGAVTVILRAWWKPAAEAVETASPAAESAPDVTQVSAPPPSTLGGDLFGTTPPYTSPYAVSAPPAVSAPAAPEPARGPRPFGRFDAPERLIAWGIVLLVMAAVAAGAISFDLASAPVR